MRPYIHQLTLQTISSGFIIPSSKVARLPTKIMDFANCMDKLYRQTHFEKNVINLVATCGYI